MDKTSIESKLRNIVVDELGVDDSDVTVDALFADDLSADSLDRIELTMRVEEDFGLQIDDKDAEQLKTFGDLVGYVAGALERKGAA